jgi:hypothetical protein
MPKLQAVIAVTADGIFSPSHFTEGRNLPNVMKEDEPPSLPDLHKRVQQVLQTHPYTKMWAITVENDGGVVVLKGRVRTYYAKQMAQEVIRPVLKEHEPHPILRNLIDVIGDRKGE